ncbi:hypothetical protein Tsubulata_002929 [Turnera subulata]|uniref:Kinetochore protein SPC25 n=1 Tax=Turnera subulata TaxID=218843 RepID=A0A9Q0JEW4_9ROSI|nr:hypothetical protein Tsubulata_002929 [Turnera subulata]
MQSNSFESAREKMESLQLSCEREIETELQRMDSFAASFYQSMDSIKERAEETSRNHVDLAKMKSRLAEAEHEFVKVLGVKTRKEAKQMATRDSISSISAKIEEHKRTLQVLKSRRDEYAAVMSQQSTGSTEGRENQEISEGEIQDAMSWYNNFLSFRVEGGRGVKFTFNNINAKDPLEEYSFTIRHENDTYTLLACHPHIDDTKELVHELNRTNGLFKFVRTMRKKFQEAVSLGTLPQSSTLHQESSMITISAPPLSVSTDGSESPVEMNEHPHRKVHRNSGNVQQGRGFRKATFSPASVRRSPRFLVISF